ncbi:peptidoglycan DD-metalloendopeptidase family protein [Streptomyces sp. 1222.5]|uniref:aggregation-promoting factor C-terminal-like domain-containing protein n=1 Tax=Streptomyces sp. 1222.5 TaxID=1881026 RepID=UPI003D710248
MVGVDVVPVAPNFHTNLKAMVLPAATRVGEDAGRRMGQAISDHIVVNIPSAIVTGGQRARVAATREGGQVGGAFGRSIKRQLEEAFGSLPRADVRLGDTGINADIDRLRARIQALSGRTIGIDIDAGAALAEITDIDARLARLAADNPSVQVRTDTAAARAALAAVQAQINDVDRDDVRVRVKADTGSAIAELRALGTMLGAVAAIPVIPVAAVGIGAIASAAVAAGAGVGALALAAIPAIKGVTSVMQMKTAADRESARATDNSAAANVKAAQTALQMANAQASLSSAHRQAAQAVAQANQAVTDAERSLTDAKRSSRQAEEDLTQARKDAAQQLRDRNDRLLDGKLDEREAMLRVKEAQEELNKVLADPKATDLQKERAKLNYDEAVRGAERARKSNGDLQTKVEEANKAGVDGTDEVKRAKERLADSERKISDQERAVADARKKVRQAQIQGAEAVESAERGVRAAQLSSIDTSTKSVTAADTYRQALANLTPSQRDLYDSIAGPKGLKSAFSAWSKSLQPEILPLFTRGVDGAKGALPGLTPLVKTAADAVGILFDKASKEMKSPFWKGFKKDIEKAAKPAIVGFGVAFGNIFKGMAGIVDAFLPHMDGFSSTMQGVTEKFADWGTHLKGSPEFEKFLDYAKEHGPVIAQTVGSIAGAFLSIGAALAPISGPLLKLLGGVADGIGIIAENAPWFIMLIYGIIVAVKLKTIPGWAGTLADKLIDAFKTATSGIKGAWLQVAGIVAQPVNFVIDFVYNKGIKAVWDKVADFVHLPRLPKAPKLLDETPKFANGGRTSGGIPGVDSIPALLMADEYVIKRSSARKIGFGALEHMNRTGEIPRFAKGGLVGGAWDWTKGAFNSGLNWAKALGDLMIHPGKVWSNLIKPTMSKVAKGVGNSPVGEIIGAFPRRMATGLKDMIVDSITGMFSGGGDVGQWMKPVNVPYGTRFGVRGPMWSSGYHTGLDFPAAVGRAVHAVDGGTVVSVGTAGPYGNHLEINHGGGLVSLYAHMSKILAGLGQVVGQGQTIGKVGATGNVTGPHLHLEARMNGRTVDPMPFLQTLRTGTKISKGIAAAKNFAKSQLHYFGWGPQEFPALDRLWTGEPGWRYNAENPSSGAYGIPQALPASKMAKFGPDWRTNAATQIQWGMDYIKHRPDYGSPSRAYSKWLSRSPHWYDDGGYLPPGLSLVANGTGSPEPVFTSQQWEDIRTAKSGSPNIVVDAPTTVIIDGNEVRGIVDQRIAVRAADTGRAIDVGRYI